jgi:hypothetical protein
VRRRGASDRVVGAVGVRAGSCVLLEGCIARSSRGEERARRPSPRRLRRLYTSRQTCANPPASLPNRRPTPPNPRRSSGAVSSWAEEMRSSSYAAGRGIDGNDRGQFPAARPEVAGSIRVYVCFTRRLPSQTWTLAPNLSASRHILASSSVFRMARTPPPQYVMGSPPPVKPCGMTHCRTDRGWDPGVHETGSLRPLE